MIVRQLRLGLCQQPVIRDEQYAEAELLLSVYMLRCCLGD